MKTFTIDATISESLLGDVPDGTRIDLQYSSGTLTFSDREGKNTSRYDGKLIAGHDWALVRTDAVCIFDGTVNATIDESGTLRPVILNIEGRADLLQVRFPDGSQPRSESDAIARWRTGFEKGTELPVVVSVTVTVGKDASQELKNLSRPVFWGNGLYRFLADQYVEVSLNGRAAAPGIKVRNPPALGVPPQDLKGSSEDAASQEDRQ